MAKIDGDEIHQDTPPLSEESLRLIPDIIKLFYIACVNTPLYPLGSEMIVQPIQEMFERLSEVFRHDEKVVFSNVKEVLVVNGQRLKEGEIKKNFEETFLRSFTNLHLVSITLKRGLTQPELQKFVTFLNKEFYDQSIEEAFKSEKIEHVVLDEVDYTLVPQGKRMPDVRHSLKDLMLVDYLMTRITTFTKSENILEKLDMHSQELADLLTEISENTLKDRILPESVSMSQVNVILELLQGLGVELTEKEPKAWEKCKGALAKTILSLKPELRSKVFFDIKKENEENLLRQLVTEIPQEILIEIFLESYRRGETSPEKMRGTIKTLLKDEKQKNQILPLIRDGLRKAGATPQEVKWISGEEAFEVLNFDEKLNRILTMSYEDFLVLKKEVDMKVFWEEVVTHHQQGFLSNVITRWKEDYPKVSYSMKREMVKDFVEVIDILQGVDERLLSSLLDLIVPLMASEALKDIPRDFFQRLSILLEKSLLQGNFQVSVKIYSYLKENFSSIGESNEHFRSVAQWIETIFTPSRLQLLIEEYIKKSSKKLDCADIIELFGLIGESVVPVLIDAAMTDETALKTLGYFDAYLRRRLIAEALIEIKKHTGIEPLVRSLTAKLKNPQWYVVKNSLELLGDIHDEGLTGLLEYPLKHEDLRIRKKAIFVLGKIGNAQCVSLLNEALKNSTGETLEEVIILLGRVGDAGSIEVLKNIHPQGAEEKIRNSISKIEERLKQSNRRAGG